MSPVGTQIITAPVLGAGNADMDAGAFFVAGLTELGSVNAPVLVRSMADVVRLLGSRVAYGAVYDALAAYFGEGGTRAYVARVVGAGATVGTRTLVDRAGTPASTLRVDAKNPGAWSANLTVEVQDDVTPNTFRLIVRYNGNVVETFPMLDSPAAAVRAAASSGYIVATELGSASLAPANNPAVSAATALSAGSDDRATVTAASYIAALARFSPELGAGLVAIPGQAHSAVGAGLIAHAQTNRRIAAVAPPQGTSVTGAISAATSLRNTAGAEHAGLFFPWVQIPDGAGGVRTVSPEGYVAGVRARVIDTDGPWRAPAGDIAAAQYVVGTELALTRSDLDSLVDGSVNPIRSGASTRLYGWRSLSTDTVNYLFLNGRDVLNLVAMLAETALERFVFRTIDGRGHLFAEVATALSAILEPIRSAGGLFEQGGDKGYRVDTGPTVNTTQTIAQGQVRATVSLRVSPVGELVRLTIAKVALGASV